MNHFAQLDREAALAKKLEAYAEVFAGNTDPLIRSERIEAVIDVQECADHVFTVSASGAPISYRLAFVLTYNRPLTARAA